MEAKFHKKYLARHHGASYNSSAWNMTQEDQESKKKSAGHGGSCLQTLRVKTRGSLSQTNLNYVRIPSKPQQQIETQSQKTKKFKVKIQ